jgi:ABC transport system ATP-binding/permease protein
VVDQLFIFDGKGGVAPFWGGYSDYAARPKTRVAVDVPVVKAPDVQPKAETAKKPSLSFKEQKEFKTLESDIEKLESEKVSLTTVFSSTDATVETYEKTGRRLTEIEGLLSDKMARWESLAERA